MTVRTPLSDPTTFHTGSRTAPAPAGAGYRIEKLTTEPALADMTWNDLRALAKRIGVTDYAKMKRPALEAAIRSAQGASLERQ